MAAKITRLPQPASHTIEQVFDEFLGDQRRRLRPRTLSKYEDVLGLLRDHLNGYAYQSLSTAEAALFDRYYNAPGDKHLEFCQLFGPDKIVANLGGFLGYFMIRKVVAGQDLKRAAGTVTKKLSTWLAAQGHVAEDEAQEGADLGAEAARDLPKAERAARILYDATTNLGVVARILTGPHDANRQYSHLPMRYDTGRPRAVIRLRISQPRTTSLPCPAGLRARRPSPMMDLYRKNVFSTRP